MHLRGLIVKQFCQRVIEEVGDLLFERKWYQRWELWQYHGKKGVQPGS